MGDASFETFFIVVKNDLQASGNMLEGHFSNLSAQNPRNQVAFRGFQALMPIQLPSCSSNNQITQVRFCEALGDWP